MLQAHTQTNKHVQSFPAFRERYFMICRKSDITEAHCYENDSIEVDILVMKTSSSAEDYI